MTAAVPVTILVTVTVLSLGLALRGAEPPRSLDERSGEPTSSSSASRGGSRWIAPVMIGGPTTIAGWLVAGPIGAAAGGLAAAVAPVVVRRRRAARQARAIEGQLIDAVTSVASALRAGRSLVQALGVAAEEVGEPLGSILSEAVDRSALGVPVDDVLDGLAERIGGADARLVAGVLRLHRRTGGAMAASLDGLVGTLRARRDGARELGSLTAQARLSAAILGLLPFGFFLFLSVVARRDVEAAYHSPVGASAIGVGLALQGAAFVWIRRLLRVEDV